MVHLRNLVANGAAAVVASTTLVAACGFDGVGGVDKQDAAALGDAAVLGADGGALADSSSLTDAGSLTDGNPGTEAGAAASIQLLSSPVNAPPSTSDLTAEGTLDWAHWGLTAQVARKATGGNLIGDYVRTGTNITAVDYDFAGWPISASWTDGPAGPTNVQNTKTHRYFVYSTDVALTLSLPASAMPRTAILYLGGYRSRGRLELSFDDAPGTNKFDERENQAYYYATRYEVRYAGGPASKKLVVRWKMMNVYEATGTIILASVALR